MTTDEKNYHATVIETDSPFQNDDPKDWHWCNVCPVCTGFAVFATLERSHWKETCANGHDWHIHRVNEELVPKRKVYHIEGERRFRCPYHHGQR